jgi:hypothetical protein
LVKKPVVGLNDRGAKIPRRELLSQVHQEKSMATRKKPSLPVAEAEAPDVESLEYTTKVEPVSPDTLSSAPVPDRETQIREAAYAAHERRGWQGGDPTQDWLDAEAEWERQQKS